MSFQNHLQLRHSDSNTNNLSTINQAQLSQPAPSAPIPAISTAQSNANNDQVNPQPERCTECGIVLEKGKEHLCPGVNKVSFRRFFAMKCDVAPIADCLFCVRQTELSAVG